MFPEAWERTNMYSTYMYSKKTLQIRDRVNIYIYIKPKPPKRCQGINFALKLEDDVKYTTYTCTYVAIRNTRTAKNQKSRQSPKGQDLIRIPVASWDNMQRRYVYRSRGWW